MATLDLVRKVLEITQYPGDKDAFIIEFDQRNRLTAFLNILDTFPVNRQKEVKAILQSQDQNAYKSLLFQDIGLDTYSVEYQNVVIIALQNLIRELLPHLSLQQKNQLFSLLEN